jgi:hypothetical protein
MGEEPERQSRPGLVSLPPPEQLGVCKPRPRDGSADWVEARRRLDTLGAVTFQVAKLPEGGSRFTCLLPTDQRNYNHRIEADATTEAEAVRLGLERAEAWARQR